MRKQSIIIMLLVKCILAVTNVPQEVDKAISEALTGKWVFRNFENSKVSMGFDSTTELSDIKTGEPFQMYYISQIDFEESDVNVSIDSILKQSNWYVPLYVNSELMETVMLIGTRFSAKEKWSAGTRSLKTLVQTWKLIKQAWPVSKGFHPRLIYISEPYENMLCFNVPEKEEPNLTIIGKLYRSFTPSPDKKDFTKLSTCDETLKSIKSRIAERLRRSDSLWAEKTRVNDSLANLKEFATEHLWKKHEMKGNKEPFIPDSAVCSWWNNMLVAADEAIIPQNMNKQELKAHKPEKHVEIGRRLVHANDGNRVEIDNQIMKNSEPLRIEAKPIDKSITKAKDHWYVLYAKDGTGFVRIGSTGPLLLVDAPYKEGQKWGLGGSRSSYGKPELGADLIEISTLSPSHLAIRWRVEKAFLKIHTESEEPIHYRISFVSELPIERTGGRYGPGVAANNYIMAVANGNLTELYRTTRTKYSARDAEKLRNKLFGVDEIVDIGSTHRKPDALEVNAEGKLHVQHVILADRSNGEMRKGWAFEIICIKRYELWLVADAYPDPELSYKQVFDIVNKDYNRRINRR